MDPYHLTYFSVKVAHQAAAPAPAPAAPQNIVYLRRPSRSMVPIYGAEGGLFPASARAPHLDAVHQAAQRKAAEEAKKKAAEEKKKEAAKKKAAEERKKEAAKKKAAEERKKEAAKKATEEKKKEAAKKKKEEDEARKARPVIINVPAQEYMYMYHHGNGDYRFYK